MSPPIEKKDGGSRKITTAALHVHLMALCCVFAGVVGARSTLHNITIAGSCRSHGCTVLRVQVHGGEKEHVTI